MLENGPRSHFFVHIFGIVASLVVIRRCGACNLERAVASGGWRAGWLRPGSRHNRVNLPLLLQGNDSEFSGNEQRPPPPH